MKKDVLRKHSGSIMWHDIISQQWQQLITAGLLMGVVSNGLLGPESFGLLPHRELRITGTILVVTFGLFLTCLCLLSIAYDPKHRNEFIWKFQSDLVNDSKWCNTCFLPTSPFPRGVSHVPILIQDPSPDPDHSIIPRSYPSTSPES